MSTKYSSMMVAAIVGLSAAVLTVVACTMNPAIDAQVDDTDRIGSTPTLMGGGGGAPACMTCGEALSNHDISNICSGTSQQLYTALNTCVCGSESTMGICIPDCYCPYGANPTKKNAGCFDCPACMTCVATSCMDELNACANDL